jgi:cytoskeleton protein RodZ
MTEQVQEENLPDSRVALGAMFRKKRESMLLDEKAVAAKLRILPQMVTGLESADYSLMKADVFTRGYIKSYATLLGLDEAKCLEMYGIESRDYSKPVSRSSELPKIAENDGIDTIVKVVVPVALVAVVWFSYKFFLSGEGIFVESETTDDVVIEEFDIEAAESIRAEDIKLPNSVEQSAASNDLVVSFKGTSAITVRDSERSLLIDDELKRKGDIVELNGSASYSLLIGYGANVEVYYQGEPVTLEYSVDNPVVKIDLGPAE